LDFLECAADNLAIESPACTLGKGNKVGPAYMVEIVTEKVGTENVAVNTIGVEAEVPAAGMFGAETGLAAQSEAEVAAASTFGAETELAAVSTAVNEAVSEVETELVAESRAGT